MDAVPEFLVWSYMVLPQCKKKRKKEILNQIKKKKRNDAMQIPKPAFFKKNIPGTYSEQEQNRTEQNR